MANPKNLVEVPFIKVAGIMRDLVSLEAYRAIHIVNPKMAITVTRRGKPDGRDSRTEFVVTVGTPNYLAAAKIKQAKRTKEPYPLNLWRQNFPDKGSRGGKKPKKAA